MWAFLTKLFDASGFPSRWNCGEWSAAHGWLHIFSDLATFGAYTAIPCVLAYFIFRKKNLVFPRIFTLFCLFIFACGTVHLVEAMIFWWPVYRFSGVMKLATAIVSWVTVFALIPVIPQALAMRTPDELENEVHERRRAEEELRNTKAFLNSIIDNLPLMLFVKDAQTLRFERINKVGEEMLGRTEDELIGKSDYDFFPEEEAEFFVQKDRETLQENRMVEIEEEELHTKTGEVRILHTRKIPILDDEGKPQYLLGISEDVTEQKRVATELKESEEQFRLVVEGVKDYGIFMLDPQGHILSWNTGAQYLKQYSPEEIIGNHFSIFYPSEERENGKPAEALDFATEIGRYEDEGWQVDKDGSRFWANVIITPIYSDDDRLKGFAMVTRDMTERKKTEKAMAEAKEAAETASESKSAFLANMSHEIRTPLNAIIGMTDLVLETRLKPTQRDYLTMVRESGEGLLAIVNDILDFSKIEANRLDLECESFDLQECLADALKSMALQAHRKGLELTYHVNPDVPAALMGDSARLRQILVNLVSNAIKFTPDGEITLRVETEIVGASDVVLHFSVVDTGIGIPPEKQATIFEAFQQADLTMTRRFGGTGLGLAIAARLVEMMGGRIWLESEVDKGSTFHFTARFVVAKPRLVERGYRESKRLRGLKVLLVQPNETTLRTTEETLASWKMQAAAVRDGKEALEELARGENGEEPFDIVLADSHLPDMTGEEFAQEIQLQAQKPPACILCIGACDHPLSVTERDRVGIRGYLTKPFKPSELFDTIIKARGISVIAEESSMSALGEPHPLPPLNVLLVEDSLVNQKLVIGLLERYGHQVNVVTNGRDAVAATQSTDYDVVLMDLQMPEMDGLEATRRIRKLEKKTGKHVPIVAMTAHALKGDDERCYEAGMDGYIPKPVRFRELFETIRKLLGGRRSSVMIDATQMPQVDWTAAMNSVQRDRELLVTVVDAFLAEAPQLLADIEAALKDKDYERLHRAAHTLKGSVRCFGTNITLNLSTQLVTAAMEENLNRAESLFPTLQEHAQRLLQELSTWMQNPQEVG